ncbi:ScbR family autoregulator-binding transcription factor [Frondihabitans australicus]|uniref:TetR family transcriptional regulator n=1 Tax=Frondihabitans australicus TaxID=386892 RepID=A0A495IJH6_9MICO|nr:ScbR family autoregulator-binding transcription factor [Frondihabitans australicus]RKR75286.1 TetR family transcriptional regulator [Frondihabitans australicus]
MAVQARAEETRRRLIEAAAEVLTERGYPQTTLNDVAARAGVTKGALYHHFASKQELANAVIALQFDIAAASTVAAVDRGTTAYEKLVWMSRAFAEQMRDEVVVRAGVRLTTETGARELEQQAPYDGWIASVTPLIAAAIAEGSFRSDLDAGVVASMLIPAYSGVQMVSDIRTGHADLLEQVLNLWEVLLAPALVAPDRRAELSGVPASILS